MIPSAHPSPKQHVDQFSGFFAQLIEEAITKRISNRLAISGPSVIVCSFWPPSVKWFTLRYRTAVLSVLSVCLSAVCNVGVPSSNGWIDQDTTWHGDSPWPGHIVLDGGPARTWKGAEQPA